MRCIPSWLSSKNNVSAFGGKAVGGIFVNVRRGLQRIILVAYILWVPYPLYQAWDAAPSHYEVLDRQLDLAYRENLDDYLSKQEQAALGDSDLAQHLMRRYILRENFTLRFEGWWIAHHASLRFIFLQLILIPLVLAFGTYFVLLPLANWLLSGFRER